MANNEEKGRYKIVPRPGSFGAKFYEVTPKSWSELKEYSEYLKGFIYRGQASNKWKLITSIERAATQYACPPDEIWQREKYLIKEFKARAHQFILSSPNDTDVLEWLSIIQDFGGPTRLLDFTDSLYIASFFAVESSNDDSCVWAINGSILQLFPHFIDELQGEGIFYENEKNSYDFNSEEVLRYAESFIVDPSKKMDLVLRVKPPRLNERLAVQKGVFLCSCNLSMSFEYNLCKTITFPFETLDSSNASDSTDLLGRLKEEVLSQKLDLRAAVIKFNLPMGLHTNVLIDLQKMNIDAASLFPGLEGFARSLHSAVRFSPQTYSIRIHRTETTVSRPSDEPNPPKDNEPQAPS